MVGPVGILGAMAEEVEAVRAALVDAHQTVRGGRVYASGRLDGTPCVVAHARCGKVAAAAAATELLSTFGAAEIVFTGVAGRVSRDLAVGDVIVATDLLQHDMDASPIFPRYEVPFTGRAAFPTDAARRAAARRAAETFLAEELETAVAAPARNRLGLRAPRVHEGMIVSGDRFFACDDAIAELRARLPAALAVEMEGAAVAQVCHDYGVPCTVIRAISDGGDDSAADDFWAALTAIASAYSLGIVRRCLAVPMEAAR